MEYKSLFDISDLAATVESSLATSDGIQSLWAMGKAALLPPQGLTGGKIPTDFKEAVTVSSLQQTVQGEPAQGTMQRFLKSSA